MYKLYSNFPNKYLQWLLIPEAEMYPNLSRSGLSLPYFQFIPFTTLIQNLFSSKTLNQVNLGIKVLLQKSLSKYLLRSNAQCWREVPTAPPTSKLSPIPWTRSGSRGWCEDQVWGKDTCSACAMEPLRGCFVCVLWSGRTLCETWCWRLCHNALGDTNW